MSASIGWEGQLLLKILEDGEWRSSDEVITELAQKIAPGKALRRYERRKASHEAKHGPRRSEELSESEKIASGQRSLANSTFNRLKDRYLDVRNASEGREVRRRDDFLNQDVELEQTVEHGDHVCEKCGLRVVDIAQHSQFHLEETHEQPMPVVSESPATLTESQIREIVRSELESVLVNFEHTTDLTTEEIERIAAAVHVILSKALDNFQIGMQSFIEKRFNEFEVYSTRRGTRFPWSMNASGVRQR